MFKLWLKLLKLVKCFFFREKEKSAATLREVDRLRSTNAELQSDMNACHLKEGELLKFTEGVTDTNVKLQSAYSLLEIKVG